MQLKRIYHNKLVRDGIKNKIEQNSGQCSIRAVNDDDEYVQELLKKVKEEAYELSQTHTREDFLSEYCDLIVVLDTLIRHLEYSEADIQSAVSENIQMKGLYKLRHFLIWSSKKNQ
jgi:predicted house-cleaning noncanonical NTP pyrophosphatase (MazG superfamily)